MVDIVERLKAFPIAEWKDAHDEIVRLRGLLGGPTNEVTIETVTYPDGTTATGTAPLPKYSPVTTDPEGRNLQDIISGLQASADALTTDLTIARNNTDQLAQKVAMLEAEIAMPKEDTIALVDTVDLDTLPMVLELRNQVADMTIELEARTSELSELRNASNNASHGASNNAQPLMLVTTQAELASANAKVAMLLDVSNANTDERLSLIKEIDSLTATVEELNNSLTMEKAISVAARDKLASLQSSMKPDDTVFHLKNLFGKK